MLLAALDVEVRLEARTGMTTAPDPSPARLKIGAGWCVSQSDALADGFEGDLGEDDDEAGDDGGENALRAQSGMFGMGGVVVWCGRRPSFEPFPSWLCAAESDAILEWTADGADCTATEARSEPEDIREGRARALASSGEISRTTDP
jgi:hypothetical protein